MISKIAIFFLVLTLLAIPLGIFEVLMGETFSSYADLTRLYRRAHRLPHTVWCFLCNSRFGFLFGALAYVIHPLLFLFTLLFSFGLLLGQVFILKRWRFEQWWAYATLDKDEYLEYKSRSDEVARRAKGRKHRGASIFRGYYPKRAAVDSDLDDEPPLEEDVIFDDARDDTGYHQSEGPGVPVENS